jgi:trk system potassium uptake protein
MLSQKARKDIIIAGCGYFGSFLAGQLDIQGENIVVVDIRSETLARLAADFKGSAVNGDASDIEILHQSGIGWAKAVIASTEDDNINLMIAQIARDIYDVPVVIALVRDAARLALKQDYSFSLLCPSVIVSQAIISELKMKGEPI